jgi:aminopeptidase
MKKTVLREYAKLIAQVGANVQKGQEVIIYAGLDQPEFVQMVAEECYKCKAREVTVQWMYQPLEKIHTRYQSVKTLGEVKDWQKARFEHYCESKPCKIHIISDDPDGLKGMNMAKLAKARKLRYPIVKEYNDRLDGMQQWVIAAVPGKAWAKKVFPGLRTSVAMEKMWEAILTTSRVNEDPVAAWKAHNADLKARCEFLNNLGIEKLHYTADNGTNLTVGMISEAMFCGGSETSRQNIVFNPNIPTEECFISPKKGEAEGIVYSTKPLCYQGQIIDKFFMRFEGGKVVESGAEVGEELLPPISGDPERLTQVFCNVLDNAAKHGGAGKHIVASIVRERGEQIVRIRDFGPGIPEAELPFVKQKFYKGTSKARGSGIGLAVCDEIINLHGGTFSIENAEGGGAEVTIRLPEKE